MLSSGDDMETIPTRRSLLSRLKQTNDQESWKVFFDTYWKLIYNAAVRAGLTNDEAQDVVQETVIGVSRRIPEFVYDPAKGSFKTWLMRHTTWKINDQLRKRMPIEQLTRKDIGTTRLERVADPRVPGLDHIWDEEWESNLLETALRRVKGKVDAKQYQIFDFCVNKQWPASKVAKDLKVNSATVYMAKHRVSNLLKKELLYLQTKPI